MKPVVIGLIALILIGCSHERAYPQPEISQSTSGAQNTEGCTLSAWIMQQQPHSTRTPELAYTLRDTVVTVNGSSHRISIPQGFTMTVFGAVPQARGLALSPDGVIYATSYKGNIYRLPDRNHDGIADSVTQVANGLGDPHGIGFYNSGLYVSNNSTLYHLVDANHDGVFESKQVVTPLPAGGGHTSRNFVIDTARKKFYVQVGSEGNMDTTDFAHRAVILEFNLDGTDGRVYARGLRNAVGMDLDPRTGALWVNVNGMDNLFGAGDARSNNNPSEGVYLVCDGANYGWPFTYGFQMRNPQQPWVNLDTNVLRTFSGPIAEVLAHEAPLGLHFYRGTALPAKYHNAIFQCYHGSWNRTPPAPPRITVMWADSDGHNAVVTDFVNGFQPDSSGNRWGRVVSVIEGADGALYASDDQAGVIYRIAWTGAPQATLQIDNSDLTGMTLQAGSHVPIRWSSINVDSVVVSFSTDGQTWSYVGGARLQPFDFLVPNSPTTSGRIKLTDARSGLESINQGTFTIESLGVTAAHREASFLLTDIFPNPASDQGSACVHLEMRTHMRAEIFGILGNLMSVVADGIYESGDHTLELPLRTLPPGNYILRVSTNGAVQSERVIVNR